MAVSVGAEPARAKAMSVSSEARPARAKATPVSTASLTGLQRRRRFHARDFRCRLEVAGPGRASSRHITAQHRRRRRCGGRRRVRRARAGFEIDHSEPQARVWRSRGRPGPKAPDTQAALTDTSMSREKRGRLRTGNRVPSAGPRPVWHPPRLCPGRPGVPQPARFRGGRR